MPLSAIFQSIRGFLGNMYLTNPRKQSKSVLRDRLDLSVVVTDEMAEAGAKVLLNSGSLFLDYPDGSEERLAQQVFEAMALLQTPGNPQ